MTLDQSIASFTRSPAAKRVRNDACCSPQANASISYKPSATDSLCFKF